MEVIGCPSSYFEVDQYCQGQVYFTLKKIHRLLNLLDVIFFRTLKDLETNYLSKYICVSVYDFKTIFNITINLTILDYQSEFLLTYFNFK